MANPRHWRETAAALRQGRLGWKGETGLLSTASLCLPIRAQEFISIAHKNKQTLKYLSNEQSEVLVRAPVS